MFRRITAFFLCILLCAAPVTAAREAPSEPLPDLAAEITVDPTQQAIADQWAALAPRATVVFSAEPSAADPYAIGALDGTYLDDGLRLVNFYRGLAGLEPVGLADHLNVLAQYGAVLLAANDDLTHTPKKPAAMSESFYRMGANACAASNISMRYGYGMEILLQSALRAHMDELSAANRLDLGHRRRQGLIFPCATAGGCWIPVWARSASVWPRLPPTGSTSPFPSPTTPAPARCPTSSSGPPRGSFPAMCSPPAPPGR